MNRPIKRTAAANTFAAFGYISVLFQWAWAALLLCYPLLTTRPDFFMPAKAPEPSAEFMQIAPALSPLATVAAIGVTLLVLVATVVVLARLPKTIGKKGAAITKTTTSAILPTLTRHKRVTKKQRKKLSYRLGLAIKLLAIVLPLMLLLFVDYTGDIPPLATWTVALFCAGCSLAYFALQQAVAYLGKIDTETLW